MDGYVKGFAFTLNDTDLDPDPFKDEMMDEDYVEFNNHKGLLAEDEISTSMAKNGVKSDKKSSK